MTVPVYASERDHVKPSAGTWLNTRLHICCNKFLWLAELKASFHTSVLGHWQFRNTLVLTHDTICKTIFWQTKYMLFDNTPWYFILMRPKPISYKIHWDMHCGHWISIGQLYSQGQPILYSINAFRTFIFATSGDPYLGLSYHYH